MKIALTIIISLLLLLISCDESFKPSEPFSYDKNTIKIDGKCRVDADCNIARFEICNITKARCLINPCTRVNKENLINCFVDRVTMKVSYNCIDNYHFNNRDACISLCENKDCGGFGKCISEAIDTFKCICDNGYATYKDTSKCEAIKNPCAGIDCGGIGGTCKIDENNLAYCECKQGYQNEIDKFKCLPKCLENDCIDFGECKYYSSEYDEDLRGKKYCECDNNYFQMKEGYYIICKTPCNENDCNNGVCKATSLTDKKCDCNEGYQDNNNDFICNISCDNELYSCRKHGSCDDSTGSVSCICNLGYQLTEDQQGCYWNGYVFNRIYSNNMNIKAMKNDSLGNLYFVGNFKGTIDFNPLNAEDIHNSNNDNIFVTKINNDGTYAWTKTFGSSNNDSANDLDIDQYDNIYIVGDFCSNSTNYCSINLGQEIVTLGKSDAFIIKLDSEGHLLWSNTVGGENNDTAKFISISKERLFISGKFEGIVNFNPNGSDILNSNRDIDNFISFYDTNGNYISTNIISLYPGSKITNVKSSYSNGEYETFISGYFKNTAYFYKLNGDSIEKSSINNNYNGFILNLNQNGVYNWINVIYSDKDNKIKDFDIDNSGNIYLAGEFCNNEIDNCIVNFFQNNGTDEISNINKQDLFISKINTDGDYFWTKVFGESGNDNLDKIKIINDNFFYLSGNLRSDVFLIKYDTNGNLFNKKKWLNNDNYPTHISFDTINSIYFSFKSDAEQDIIPGTNEYILGDASLVILKFQENEPDCMFNTNCGGHGLCLNDSNNIPYCECDNGYQDNDNDLYCEPACNENLICSNHGTCNDNGDELICDCDNGYEEINNFYCNKLRYKWSKIIKKGYSENVLNPIKILKKDDFLYIAGNYATKNNDNYKIDFDFSDGIDKKASNTVKNDIFLLKMNKNGDYIYTKTLGGNGSDNIYLFENYENSFYLAGDFESSVDFNFLNGDDIKIANNGDKFIAKLNTENEYAWTIQLDADLITSIAPDAQGIYVLGDFSNQIDLNHGINNENIVYANNEYNSSTFWVKYDNNGNYLNGSSFTGGSYIWSDKLIVTDTSIYVIGIFSGNNANFGGNDYYNGIDEDIYINKISKTGNYQWTKIISGDGDERLRSACYKNGFLYLAGKFKNNLEYRDINGNEKTIQSNGAEDSFISKLNSNGEIIWLKTFGDLNSEIINDIKVNDSGEIFITGFFNGSFILSLINRTEEYYSNGGRDAFIAKLDNNGNFLYFDTLGSQDNDAYHSSLCLDTSSIYLLGNSGDKLDYDVSNSFRDFKGGNGIFILNNLK